MGVEGNDKRNSNLKKKNGVGLNFEGAKPAVEWGNKNINSNLKKKWGRVEGS